MTGCLKGIRSFCLFNNSHAGQARVFEIRARVIIDACLALRSMKKSGSELFEKDGPSPPDNEWFDSSPEERIEAVWTLTELCLAWKKDLTGEPRLQRTVTHIQRAGR